MMRIFPAILIAACFHLTAPRTALASDVPTRAEVELALKSNNAERITQVLKQLNHSARDDFESIFYRGLVYLKREQHDSAMASFSVIPVASPFYLAARNNMAAIYAAQGKPALAKNTLEDAFKSNQSLELMYKNLNDLKSHLAFQNYASALQMTESGKSPKLSLVVSTGFLAQEPPKAASTVLADAGKAAANRQELPPKTAETPAPKPSVAAAPANAPVQTPPAVPSPAKAERPQPAPASPPAVSVAGSSKEEAESTKAALQALHEWSQAWERKDMERYLKSYANDFVPSDGKSHTQWVKDRQLRILSKGAIRISLRQIEPTVINPAHIKIRFRQNYQADQLKVSGDKVIEMKWVDQRWVITAEHAFGGGQK